MPTRNLERALRRGVPEPLRSQDAARVWLRMVAVCALALCAATALDAGPRKRGIQKIDPGSDPKRLLQLHPVEGAKQKLAVSLTIEELLAKGSHATIRASHQIEGEWNIQTLAVQPDSFSYTSALELQQLEPSVTFAGNFHARTDKDLQGRVLEMAADEDTSEATDLRSLKLTHTVFDMLYPSEMIGLGSRWRTQRKLNLDEGLTVAVDMVFELKALDADRALIVYSITGKRRPVAPTYKNKVLDLPSYPLRQRFFVSVQGTGKAVQDLSQIYPSQAEFFGQVVFEIQQGHRWFPLSAGEQLTIKIEQQELPR